MIDLHNWTTKQIDYVQAFPQAPAEKDLYLKVPAGFEVEGGKKGDYVLKLHKNVYGQKQAGRVWYSFLSFFWSGHRGSKAYSLWGGVVPSPSIVYDYL